MKTPIQFLLLVALLLVVFYTSFYTSRQVTNKMNEQLESLQHTQDRYNQIVLQYDSSYHQLVDTRQRLARLEEYYNQHLTVQQAELQDVLNQMYDISHKRRHRRNTYPIVMHPIDSLLFIR